MSACVWESMFSLPHVSVRALKYKREDGTRDTRVDSGPRLFPSLRRRPHPKVVGVESGLGGGGESGLRERWSVRESEEKSGPKADESSRGDCAAPTYRAVPPEAASATGWQEKGPVVRLVGWLTLAV